MLRTRLHLDALLTVDLVTRTQPWTVEGMSAPKKNWDKSEFELRKRPLRGEMEWTPAVFLRTRAFSREEVSVIPVIMFSYTSCWSGFWAVDISAYSSVVKWMRPGCTAWQKFYTDPCCYVVMYMYIMWILSCSVHAVTVHVVYIL